MNEFVEMLIDELKKSSYKVETALAEIQCLSLNDAIKVVNQVAEKYKECTLCYLGSPCEYQQKGEQLWQK